MLLLMRYNQCPKSGKRKRETKGMHCKLAVSGVETSLASAVQMFSGYGSPKLQ
jgi:hypothetical protein